MQRKFSLEPLDKGKTPLHELILNCTSYAEIENFILRNDKHVINRMVKTINDDGYSVLDLVESTNLDKNERLLLTSTLLELMNAKVLDLNEEINFKELQNNYKLQPGTYGHKLYETACTIANVARYHIKKSATHGQVNGQPLKKMFKLQDKIEKTRKESNANYNHLLFDVIPCQQYYVSNKGDKNYQVKSKLTHKQFLNFLRKYVQPAIIDQKGNCDEMTCIALYSLTILDNGITAEAFSIKNGDHVVLVLGRDLLTNKKDSTTWNNDCIICDAHAGKVYPLSDLINNTIAYNHYIIKSMGKKYIYHLDFFFNPSYHQFEYHPINLNVKFMVPEEVKDMYFKSPMQKTPETIRLKTLIDQVSIKNEEKMVTVKDCVELNGKKIETSCEMNRLSYLKLLKNRSRENKVAPGYYCIPHETEKYALISSSVDERGWLSTYKSVVLRNIEPDANILGFSIHYYHREGESSNQLVIDFGDEVVFAKFMNNCLPEIKELVNLSGTISAANLYSPSRKEQYKFPYVVSCKLDFKDNPPCYRSANGEIQKSPKKLKTVLDSISQVDPIDNCCLKRLYGFFDIREQTEEKYREALNGNDRTAHSPG